jgi:hypothetical protein
VKRGAYWTGVVLGVVLLVGGGTLAALGYAETAGPGGAVRGYFAALAGGHAAKALAYGDVPAGPRTFLTDAVLEQQRRIAPLRHFTIRSTDREGDRARVSVRYVLDFAGAPQTVNESVALRRDHGDWRLTRAAVPTVLDVDRARRRMSIAGAVVPDGDILLFPGAVPITFDTPYLQLDPNAATVGFAGDTSTDVFVEVSRAGRAAAVRALTTALTACLRGVGDAACPLPDERYVPDSLRGRLAGAVADEVKVTLDDSAEGILEFAGSVPVDATAYRRLNFSNRPVAGSGRVQVKIHARAFAVRPLQIRWTQP